LHQGLKNSSIQHGMERERHWLETQPLCRLMLMSVDCLEGSVTLMDHTIFVQNGQGAVMTIGTTTLAINQGQM